MKLTSDAFSEGEVIPRAYTCKGKDKNPALFWENVPTDTKSFALIVDDPDAPMGTWKHWLIKDIPSDTRSIPTDTTCGTELENDFGKYEYGGPCPPSGTHRYFFRLYALDVARLDATTAEALYREVEKHCIQKASLMGTVTKS